MKEDKNVEKTKKLNEDELDKVSGGYTFSAGRYAGDTSKSFEVIDDATGNVVGRYATEDEAIRMAKKKHQSQKSIKSWNELYRLRRTKSKQ